MQARWGWDREASPHPGGGGQARAFSLERKPLLWTRLWTASPEAALPSPCKAHGGRGVPCVPPRTAWQVSRRESP